MSIKNITPLSTAIRARDLNAVNIILEGGANPNLIMDHQAAPLFIAIQQGDLAIVDTLLSHGADINHQTSSKFTPVAYAIYTGRTEIVDLLIRKGSDISENYNATNLLTLAAENGELKIGLRLMETGLSPDPLLVAHAIKGELKEVRYLYQLGADINTTTGKHQTTALMEASKNGHLSVVEFLLAMNPDIELKDHDGWTALYFAAREGWHEVVLTLIKHGADINAKAKNNWTPLITASRQGNLNVVSHLLSAQADINAQTTKNQTALYWAATKGHLEVVQALLNADAKVNTTTPDGWSPLSSAAFNGYSEIVKALLPHDPDLDVRTRSHRRTALIHAAKRGYPNIVEQLLDAGANTQAQDKDGHTALYWAAEKGEINSLRLLIGAGSSYTKEFVNNAENGKIEFTKNILSAGGNPNIKNNKGVAALHRAARKGHQKIVELLLENGANPNLTETSKQHTPLMRAASTSYISIVNLLITHGADLHARTGEQWTPLMFAARYGSAEVLEHLHKKGARLDVHNRARWTPLMVATRGGHKENVQYLLENGADIYARNQNKYSALSIAEEYGFQDIYTLIREYELNHSNYSPWQSAHEYQNTFDKFVSLGRYPIDVQGRCEQGVEQFRARFVLYPKLPFHFYSYSRMSQSFFENKNQDLQTQGYQLIFKNQFSCNKDTIYFQSTWTKNSGQTSTASQNASASYYNDKAALELAKETNTLEAFEEFLMKYPKSAWRESAIYYRDKAALENAKKIGTREAFESFFDRYPESQWTNQARHFKQHSIQ